MTKIGYARVSTEGQHLRLQRDALHSAGITDENIYTDKMSGGRDDRPELARCLDALTEGDTLVVWRLDRLGRSTGHLLSTIEDLHSRGISFESLHDRIDTTSATGRLVFHVLAAISQFERDLTRERVLAGVKAAHSRRGRWGPDPVLTPEKLTAVRGMLDEGKPFAEAARVVNVSRSTLYRHLEEIRSG
jgi:DNA invertase Pin-like site-specific DNA recombinase